MALILKNEIVKLWEQLSYIESCISRDYIDDEFSRLINSIFQDIRFFSHQGISQAYFKLLFDMARKEKFKSLSLSHLQRPFGLISTDNHVGFVKCTMALINSLPFEHYSTLILCFLDRFERESSFLVVSEEWDKISEGLKIASKCQRILPQLNLELSNAIEDNQDVLYLIPPEYIELLIEQASNWDDLLLAKLVYYRSDVFDCVYLVALNHFKIKEDSLDHKLVELIRHLTKESRVKSNLRTELILQRPSCQLIIDQFSLFLGKDLV